jgi:glycosyltransferase involved in cell wall biosynthesis
VALFSGRGGSVTILYWRYFFTPPGGWGKSRGLYLAQSWHHQGYPVWVLASGSYFPDALRLRLGKRRVFRTKEGIPIIWYPTPYHQRQPLRSRLWSFVRYTIFSLYVLYRLRRRKLYILAVTPPPTTLWGAALWCRLMGQPFALEVTDAWPHILEDLGLVKGLFRGLLRWAFRWGYRQADFIAAYSPGIQEALRPLAGKTPLILSHNGTNPRVFRRVGPPPYLPFRLVYAGTFGRVNHLDFLLEVAKHLLPWRGIEIWLLGDGSERPRLEATARHLPNLWIFPPVPPEELPYWLSQCHIGVSTVLPAQSLATNAASKFYHYLANGLVVGLSYGGWQAEVLSQYQCGFSAEEPALFAEKVLYYYFHRRIWWEIQAFGRLIAEQFFDQKVIGQQLLEKIRTFAEDVRAGVATASAAGGGV